MGKLDVCPLLGNEVHASKIKRISREILMKSIMYVL